MPPFHEACPVSLPRSLRLLIEIVIHIPLRLAMRDDAL